MAFWITVHLLAAITWIGGMFYAYMAMRPAVATVVSPAQRPGLWAETLKRFFAWVWLAVGLLMVSGYVMLLQYFGGFAGAGVHIHIMQVLGWLMVLLFAHVYFAPFRRLKLSVAAGDLAAGGVQIGQIRRIVAINLILGLALVCVASAGRFVH